MKRVLSPATNAPGLIAFAAALWALGNGIWNVLHHTGALSPQVVTAAVLAGLTWYARTQVTPVADPVVPGKIITDAGGQAAPLLTGDELAALKRLIAAFSPSRTGGAAASLSDPASVTTTTGAAS